MFISFPHTISLLYYIIYIYGFPDRPKYAFNVVFTPKIIWNTIPTGIVNKIAAKTKFH